MNDIITIPAGVIMPKELLMWLRKQRDASREMAADCAPEDGDYDRGRLDGYAAAFDMVIQHISLGGGAA